MTELMNRSPFILRGFGWFNVFFAAEFLLAAGDWISLNLVLNALLMVWLLVPLNRPALALGRNVAGWIAALALIYAESWLPGLESLTANAKNIQGFSWDYLTELAGDLVNWQMAAWLVVLAALYLFLRNWLRLSVFTVLYFAAGVVLPWAWQELRPADVTDETAPILEAKTDAGAADNAAVAQWHTAFLDYEKNRRARLPAGLSEKDTPFDILILNICSLANDDLEIEL